MEQDLRWIKQIRKNNQEAANQLISNYYKEIFVFVQKQTLDSELSLDLTQEIFISVLKSLDRFDHKKASFRTWLYRIAANRIVDYFRSRQYQALQIEIPIEDREFNHPEDMVIILEYKEDLMKITALINQMSVDYQQILRLKLFGDYTLQETADMLQVPLSTVKTKYYKAIRLIKQEMEAQNS